MKIGGVEPFAVLALDERRAPGAGVVARPGPFDLDDVGAEIGKRLTRPGPGEDAREFENFQAGQRFQGALLRSGDEALSAGFRAGKAGSA